MSVKINVKKELGISKPIEVKSSNKNFRSTLELQKKMAHLSIIEHSDPKPEEYIEEMLSVQKSMISYLTATLKVEEELIDELEFTETMELSIKVSGALMGVEPESATEGETSLKA